MSCEPPVSGRVNAIKNQFENLSYIESLDITGLKNKKTEPAKPPKFQRSKTSFEIIRKSVKNQNISEKVTGNSDFLKEVNDYKKSKQAKLSKEAEEVKLNRHTSDPIKRSSIKRSPAFRVIGGTNNNIINSEKGYNKSDSLKQPSSKLLGGKKIESFLLNKCPTDIEKLQQPGLTDSLRYALKQPLPCGPPPKKPPRIFATSSDDTGGEDSPTKHVNPIIVFEERHKIEGKEIKDKINFLESHLFLKKNNKKSLQKSKTELVLQSSKLLDCLSCRKSISNVYDTVAADERKPLVQSNFNSEIVKRFANSVKPAEPIYMEPFSHLKLKQPVIGCKINNDKSVAGMTSTSAESVNDLSISESICSCPENHDDKGDLHYLCSPIDDSLEDSINLDNERKLSLGKTYDEITILVDAAFQQKRYENENIFLENLSNENNVGKISTVRLSRTLTEKRKDYVRRIAILPEKQIQTYGTLHKTFKSPIIKTFSVEEDDKYLNDKSVHESHKNSIPLIDRIDNYKKLIEDNSLNSSIALRESRSKSYKNENKKDKTLDENTLAENLEVDNFNEKASREKLFQVCMLVGYNTSSKSSYMKSKFPKNEQTPDNIEQLVFPSEKLIRSGKDNQEYCLILTDDNGYKIYGYCRRILPENCDICLPLCYCIITETKALGFYQKLLKEIETRHGQSDTQSNLLLKSLQNLKIPSAGKYLHIKLPLSIRPKTFFSSNHKISPKRLSLEANPKWLIDSSKAITTFTDNNENDQKGLRKLSLGQKSLLEEYEEKKSQSTFDYGLLNRSLIMRDPKFDEILIRRPNDLRLENTELSELLMCLSSELLVTVFSTLLLERKVILQSTNITVLSKSILALQTILYPFQWQYTIVTILPENLIEICQAPFPILVGTLEDILFEIEDGIIVDLDKKCIKQNCGDEQTILPDSLRESLQLSLEMVDLIDQGKMLSSVLISEAFLRFFVELFGNYQQKYFHKEEFIQCHLSQNVKFFLEWFVETSMFRNFGNYKFNNDNGIAGKDDNFYDLFDARLMEKSQNKSKTSQNIETIVKNSKIINKKGKTFKERFKHFLSHN